MKRVTRILARLLIVGLLAALLSSTVLALHPIPVYEPATVDGDPSEWVIPDDLFAEMERAFGQSGNPISHLSDLYLRYDCSTGTLYVLVLIILCCYHL